MFGKASHGHRIYISNRNFIVYEPTHLNGEPKEQDPGYHGHHTTPNKRNPYKRKILFFTNTS